MCSSPISPAGGGSACRTSPTTNTLAPDWVCEVISPSTGALDRARKLPLYAAAGVGHAWRVEPLERTLEVLRRQERSVDREGPDYWVKYEQRRSTQPHRTSSRKS